MRWRRRTWATGCGLALVLVGVTDSARAARSEPGFFSSRVLATGFGNPWEITWGPDGALWVTEQDSGRVSRVRPSDGAKTTALEIAEVFRNDATAQDGLMGMALDPAWSRGPRHRRVYLAYAYDADPGPQTVVARVKIRRYTYSRESKRLLAPVDLITGMPAGNDHDSGRLAFGPDGKLYYTIGDQGANQLANFCKPIRAQQLPTADEVRAQDWRTTAISQSTRTDGPSTSPRTSAVSSATARGCRRGRQRTPASSSSTATSPGAGTPAPAVLAIQDDVTPEPTTAARDPRRCPTAFPSPEPG